MRETRTVITIRCDRPRCGRTISENHEELSDIPTEERPADLVVMRAGAPDIVYRDLCPICTKATDNYVLGIEKKTTTKKAEPAAPVEPVDPGGYLLDDELGAWVRGDSDGVSPGTVNYSHVEVNERTTVIPELEGITDLEEARELIEAAATAGTGEPSDR